MDIQSVVETKCEQLLLKAFHFGASDLYLQPSYNYYVIQLRKYNKLFPSGELPFELGDRMISYFKYLASLDISEKRRPQSGSFQKAVENHLYAFRVSTLPSVFHRESVVIRLMLQNSSIPLSSLCYNQQSANKLLQLVEYEQGLILFSGATGSGKTTSLYSLIHYCSEQLGRHVISLEDPVESSYSHFLQIQVNERAGITYETGLKAILRHSPDVIMIGEIRDEKTAKIAVQASFTGHLVLSTIHAKDSVNCLYRLMDLGISIEDIRQSLIGIIAQNLVSIGKWDERKAIFEILSGHYLDMAVANTKKGETYVLPHHESLQYQMNKIEEEDCCATTI